MKAVVSVGVLALLAACASTFSTDYAKSVDPGVSRNWRLAAVNVQVPDSLTISEQNVLVPDADIVWQQEDPPGDRRAQVAAIMSTAVTAGASGLHGHEPVNLVIVMQRFHALTPSAEALEMDNVGVLNVDFTIEVDDAATGKVLVPAQQISAALPGLTGQAAVAARAQGQTQKTEIEAHVRAVVAGWLGIGPDARNTFQRIGA
ncbi:MAG: hypothetical protein GC186_04780 [Rhodobacteraceae bacterium]|nr:hypothetical protein [Paracoccaceae bacterium]